MTRKAEIYWISKTGAVHYNCFSRSCLFAFDILKMFSSNSPILRILGSCASLLICVHALRFLFTAASSPWRALHNFADLLLFSGFGFAGLIAELFPRESFPYKLLKTNLPFLNSLLGRSAFYIFFAMFAVGNYSGVGNCLEKPGNFLFEESLGIWGYFCILSGIYIAAVGGVSLYTALRYRVSPSSPGNELLLAQPVTSPPNAESERILVPFAPFPTQV